jgi:hypothetical protein
MFLEPDHALVPIMMACDGNLVQLEAGWQTIIEKRAFLK